MVVEPPLMGAIAALTGSLRAAVFAVALLLLVSFVAQGDTVIK